MALSGNAQKALEQVKMGLFMLYGADYFSEDEWIKIDGLIHKGKYVFTNGPSKDLLEEPLINFDEMPEKEASIMVSEVEPASDEQRVAIVLSEESSPSSEKADSVLSRTETSNETSAETSDEDSAPQIPVEVTPTFETEAKETARPEASQEPKPRSIGLPPGFTQEQLDEIRAFNAGLTKAGQKKKLKYEKVEDRSSVWTDAEPSPEELGCLSPAPTEREARITSWADEVAEEEATDVPQIQSPAPIRASGHAIAPSIASSRSTAATQIEVRAQQFIQTHGRPPKTLNDVFQPNNPLHNPKRPKSQVSVRTHKTHKSVKSVAKQVVSQLTSTSNGNSSPSQLSIVPGKIYTAQSGAPRKGIRMDVRPGDNIKVIKFVSGVMYIGQNMRTNLTGQFPDSIFKRAPDTAKEDPLIERQRAIAVLHVAETARASPAVPTIDEVENMNAAEWDEVPVKRAKSPSQPYVGGGKPAVPTVDQMEKVNAAGWDEVPITRAKPPSRPFVGGGLAASRFSVLADLDTKSVVSEAELERREITSAMEKEFGKMLDEKIEEVLRTHGLAPAVPTPIPRGPRASRISPKEPTAIIPKTNTCWFWSVKNDCRFTAEECRDLHAHVPGEPTNLRGGKPTWGALADHISPSSPAPTVLPSTNVIDKSTGKTCFYWASKEGCNYSAENCKYLHEHSLNGVAPRPKGGSHYWVKEKAWRSGGKENEDENGSQHGEEGQGELVLEEVKESGVNAWGEPSGDATWGESTWGGSTWGDDKYKPPHIKALEEKASAQAVGW